MYKKLLDILYKNKFPELREINAIVHNREKLYRQEMIIPIINERAIDPLIVQLAKCKPFAITFSYDGYIKKAIATKTSIMSWKSDSIYESYFESSDNRDTNKSGVLVILEKNTGKRYEIKNDGNGKIDAHAHVICGNKILLLKSYVPKHSHYKADILATLVEEVDFNNKNPRVLWRSDEHFIPSDTSFTQKSSVLREQGLYDHFHPNALAVFPNEDILISGRHVNQVLCFDPKNGNARWRLGGKRSDFVFLNDTQNGFSHQHSVSILSPTRLLIYDNGNMNPSKETRVVEYELDYKSKTATLVWEFKIPGLYTSASGSVQRLPNGNTLICWGNGINLVTPEILEVTPEKEILLEIKMPKNTGRYTASKH